MQRILSRYSGHFEGLQNILRVTFLEWQLSWVSMSHLQSASASLYASAFGITVDSFHCRLGKLDVPEIPRGSGNRATIDPFIVTSFASEVAKYLRALEGQFRLKIRRIAIDAPNAPRENHQEL